jgi:hypothetical protein
LYHRQAFRLDRSVLRTPALLPNEVVCKYPRTVKSDLRARWRAGVTDE